MPINDVTQAFILGRNLALQQRAQQQAQENEQKRIQIAEQEQKRREQQEERLKKQSELQLNAAQAELNLEKAKIRAGIQSGVGAGTIPVSGVTKIPGQSLQLPNGENLQIGADQRVLNPGGIKPTNMPELEQVLGDISFTPEEFKAAEAAEARKRGLARETALSSPSVITQQLRTQAQFYRDHINRTNKLFDEQTKRTQSMSDKKEMAEFNDGLIRSRQQAARNAKVSLTKTGFVPDDIAGVSANIIYGTDDLQGSSEFKNATLQQANLLAPALFEQAGIDYQNDPVFQQVGIVPITPKQGQAIADTVPGLFVLQRMNRIIKEGTDKGHFPVTLLDASIQSKIEAVKNIAGLSKISKELEPLRGDAIAWVRSLGDPRPSEKDVEAVLSGFAQLGLTRDMVNQRSEFVESMLRTRIQTATRGISPSQLQLAFPELQKINEISLSTERDIDPDIVDLLAR